MRRCALSSALRGLTISSLSGAHQSLSPRLAAATRAPHNHQENVRAFSSTASRPGDWLEPAIPRSKKMFKGRPRVRTGGSTKGTTVVYGDWGLRMIDHHRRISAAQLKVAEETIKRRLRGERYRFYKRVTCNIGVFMSGNEVRNRLGFREYLWGLLTPPCRCVWARAKAHSTTGQQEWPSIKLCSS